jgi:hypothetical protein
MDPWQILLVAAVGWMNREQSTEVFVAARKADVKLRVVVSAEQLAAPLAAPLRCSREFSGARRSGAKPRSVSSFSVHDDMEAQVVASCA